MGVTAVVLLSNIESHQTETIGAILNQLSQFIPNLFVVDFYKNNKMQKMLNNDSVILVKANQWNYETWSQMYNHYKYMVAECDNIILIKTPVLRDNKEVLNTDMLMNISKNIIADDKWNMQYDFMKRLIERLVFVKACRRKNVIQFMIDPEEVDFSSVWNFKSYSRYGVCNWGNVEYIPMYEWALYNTFVQDIPKAQELYFIASAYTDERKEYLSAVKTEIDKKLGRRRIGFVRNNPSRGKVDYFDVDGRERRVKQDTYLYNLMLSKYTIINPSYMKERFNIVRFMEAIICNCVPLILNDVNLDDLRLTFPDIYDIINKRELIVAPENVCVRLTRYFEDAINGSVLKQQRINETGVIKRPDMEVCNLIKKTDSFKLIVDEDYISGFYKTILI